jgi:ribosomal protein S8
MIIISKPSNNRYLKLKDLYKLNYKKNLFILSTSKGLKTLLECKTNNLGGKLLFLC